MPLGSEGFLMKRIWVDIDKCLGCKTCELQCAIERDSISKTLSSAALENPKPAPRVGVYGSTGASFPIQCRHCQDAPCLKGCPSGAMQRDADKGTIFVVQNKCRGCWMCVMLCPFGVVTPSSKYKVAVKCDACMNMEEPACVASCPTGALIHCDDEAFVKVLTSKQGKVSVFAKSIVMAERPNIVSLDITKEGKE